MVWDGGEASVGGYKDVVNRRAPLCAAYTGTGNEGLDDESCDEGCRFGCLR